MSDGIELDTPVRFVKGVGPLRAEQLAQLGVTTVYDLLTYFPRRFDLRRQAQPIVTINGTEASATAAGEVVETEDRVFGPKPFFRCTLTDGTAMINARWFFGGYLRDKIKKGVTLAVSGKVSRYRECPEFVNPRLQILWDESTAHLQHDEMLPVYPAGGKLSSGVIAQLVHKALPLVPSLITPWFDREYLRRRELMPRPAAIAAMHRPEDRDQWRLARRRLAYDECLLMQLGIAILRARREVRPAYALPCTQQIDQRIRARFPFTLTPAQDQALAEIVRDLASPMPMNRLLQGDVGSGKTVVALYAALLAVANRKQAAIMAPTEILASQHFRKIEQYLAGSRVKVALLSGQTPAKKRQELLAALATGEVQIVVGTHALLGDDVRFAGLALVVIDEQHKFGVLQRTGIRGKGYAPHYLVMTATPIPRTLAMTVFGDLETCTITAPPPGRGRTVTKVVEPAGLRAAMGDIRRRLAAGEQAYFIYPLVNPSPELELANATEAYEELSRGELKGLGVGLIHGQMPPAQKDSIMRDFAAGRIRVLAASIVVEVGLDVPAANIIVINHAERFGLAQLHQLRGRVGRGESNATCILVAAGGGEEARRRLGVLEKCNDGFAIAEEDLRIRGPGELFGTRQHGLSELKVADLVEDFELLRMARRDAFEIVRNDPTLSDARNQQLRREVIRAYAGRLDLLGGG